MTYRQLPCNRDHLIPSRGDHASSKDLETTAKLGIRVDAHGQSSDPDIPVGGKVVVITADPIWSPFRRLHRNRRTWGDAYAALIRCRTALDAEYIALSFNDVPRVIETIAALPTNVETVFLIGLPPYGTALIQHEIAAINGPLVIADNETMTASLAALTLTALDRQGVWPWMATVYISESRHAPLLEEALASCGIRTIVDIDTGNSTRSEKRQLISQCDVLVDLSTTEKSTSPLRCIRLPADPFEYSSLPLPGLLSAGCGHRITMMTPDLISASARALRSCTAAHRFLPDITDHSLVRTVSEHVGIAIKKSALHTRLRR
ncbi:hypothetical protein [Rhodococcus sp. OK302]|uniref:hypothetical protein n=1 Tax=Rhodococcus sp. OK302 TaxID=1882769 RepID=UPI000B93BCC8|nr:hypothetical protein [Rhodococcus sp. OK302]OYD61093.1 hypothetical protein BDB13_6032 [Rhodococcus sp. OK302]